MHTETHMHAYCQSWVIDRLTGINFHSLRVASGSWDLSQLPEGSKLGCPILLCSEALLSLHNSKHHWHLHPNLLYVTLYPACNHPLISVLFASTIPPTTCPILSPFYSFFFLNGCFRLCQSLPTWLRLCNTWPCAFHVCPRRCISVTSGAGSQ